MGRQTAEVGGEDAFPTNSKFESLLLLVGQAQEVLEDAEFVHQFERRRVYCIASEVAEKVGVPFEGHDVHAASGKEITEHHSCGSADDDATRGVHAHIDVTRARGGRAFVHAQRRARFHASVVSSLLCTFP